MISNNLKELGEYAEDLEKEDPLDLLNYYFNKKMEDLENIPDYQLKIGDDLSKSIKDIIKNYDSKEIISTHISYQLLIVLVSYIKKTLIEEKANSLGIEKSLYKHEMKMLFKGKWK
jgi:hypothetical protein